MELEARLSRSETPSADDYTNEFREYGALVEPALRRAQARKRERGLGLTEGSCVGPYKLSGKLGDGSMGTVWLAEQTNPNRLVALKVVKGRKDSTAVLARFQQERQVLARFDHPNIAPVFDGGATDEGSPYFVMALVEGIPITEYCDSHRMDVPARLGLFVPVCLAVQHAHGKGIVHRDLKPSNVLVCLSDGQAVPKVIDFGLAKALHQPLAEAALGSERGLTVGAPLYMSPEQAEIDQLGVDATTDVYSLGVLLYELLTGTTPLADKLAKATARQELVRLIKDEEPAQPSTRVSSSSDLSAVAAKRGTRPEKLARQLRGGLDWIVMKALRKDRLQRYETAKELAADVRRYLADEAVEAAPQSVSYRLKKFVQRNKGAVLAACIVLFALLAGTLGATVGLIRATEAAEAARLAHLDADGERQEAESHRRRAEAREQEAESEKARAEGNAQKALEEERVAQQARDFLLGLLGQADVAVQADELLRVGGFATEASRDVTVRELLDRAAAELSPEKIEGNFPRQPRLQAEILRTVGSTYRGAGEPRRAVELLQRAAAIALRHLQPSHQARIDILHDLAWAYRAAGRPVEAIRHLEATRDVVAKHEKFAPDHPSTLKTLHNLAMAYKDAGQDRDAVRLLEQVRDVKLKKLGPNHPATLNTLDNLAGAKQAAGELAEAIRLFEEVRSAKVRKLGADHPDTLVAINNLAGASQADNRLPQAIELYEQIWKVAEDNLGPGHLRTLIFLENLANSHSSANQPDKAIPLFERGLRLRADKFGAGHPKTLHTMANLGGAYRDAGRLDKSLPLLEEAHRKGKSHESLAWVGESLLAAYVKAGKTSEANRLIRDVLADARTRLPADSPPLADLLARLITRLLSLEQFAEAEKLLRECLAIREKLVERKQALPWHVANARVLLGGALLRQKKYDEAERLLLAGYKELKDEKSLPPQAKNTIRYAIQRLVALYDATRKQGEATRWRKELAAISGQQPREP